MDALKLISSDEKARALVKKKIKTHIKGDVYE